MSAKQEAPLRKVHFTGVCGTAMGSLAAGMHDRGVEITGSDANIYPPMSTFLEGRGIKIKSGFRAENIPDDADFVVIGNAMSRGNPEVEEVLNRKLLYYSLPEALKMFYLRGTPQPGCHRNARQNHHDLAAGVDFRIGGPGAFVADRRDSAQSRARLPPG